MKRDREERDRKVRREKGREGMREMDREGERENGWGREGGGILIDVSRTFKAHRFLVDVHFD